MKKASVLGLLSLAGALALAQVLAPGQLPPMPPAQPGQPGPPSAKTGPAAQVAAPTTTEEPLPTADFGIRVRNVLVPTTVLDPDGHGYVNGLTSKDFEVFDNDKLQSVASEFTQEPMSVVLVVQANSEVEPLLPKIRKSGLLLQGLVTGQEGDAAILAFDHRMRVMQNFTRDADALDDAMQKVTSGSSTAALVDAVVYADHMLKEHDPRNVRRRVIILMSRNVDKGSEAKLQETARAMQFDNVIVYAINISKFLTSLLKKEDIPRPFNGGIPASAMSNGRGTTMSETDVIQQQTGNGLEVIPPIYRGITNLFKKTPSEAFTQFTGGNIYSFMTERALADAISDIGKDLASQYLLSYNPNDKNDPGFHNIRVAVNRPGLVVRTRPGYWAVGGQQ